MDANNSINPNDTNISNTNISSNIVEMASELSEIIGKTIMPSNIFASPKGRFYYIQCPKEGAPMILNHYRGGYFVDVNPDDFEKIASGEISAHEYITTASWQVGYYWGGGEMIGGGYYQPMDIIGHKDEVRRYLQILNCRGFQRACGNMPSETYCAACPVGNCPFSRYKIGNWALEIQEYDPRVSLWQALCTRFSQEVSPAYTLSGFYCGPVPEENEIALYATGHFSANDPFVFKAYASDSVIRSLLMRETIPANWVEYAKSFQFTIYIDGIGYPLTPETLARAFSGIDFSNRVAQPTYQNVIEKIPSMIEKAPMVSLAKNLFGKIKF